VRSRFWTLVATVAFATLTVSGALAQTASATTNAGAHVNDAAGIGLTGQVIFQDIVISPQITVGPGINATSDASANVTVLGSDAVSLAVPETFELTRTGGVETLTVQTSSSGDFTAIDPLQGMLAPGEALSIDVGGTIRVSADQLAPGEYRGLLVVVAQYN
jgi:translation initiation factor 2 gamma subunit (eIF-2gamma)